MQTDALRDSTTTRALRPIAFCGHVVEEAPNLRHQVIDSHRPVLESSQRADHRFLGLLAGEGCPWVGTPLEIQITFSQEAEVEGADNPTMRWVMKVEAQ